MTTLNRKANYFFKVTVNHGNILLNDSHGFNEISDFKDYLRGLSEEMKRIRTVRVKNLDTGRIIFEQSLRFTDSRTKYKL